MYMFMLSGCSNAMNMAQATELWIHRFGHFLSVLHCRVCACGHWHGCPSTSSSLVMSWSGSRSSVRLPSSSPSAYTLLLMSYYGNKPIRKPSENVSKGRTQRRKASHESKDCVILRICSLPTLTTSYPLTLHVTHNSKLAQTHLTHTHLTHRSDSQEE